MSIFNKIGNAIGNAAKDVGHAVESAAKDVAHAVVGAEKAVEKAVNQVADGFANEVKKDAGALVGGIAKNVVLPSMNLGAPSLKLGETEIKTPKFLQELFGTTRPEMDKFVKSTQDFRDTMKTLNTVPKGDPRYTAAAAHLQSQYGYTPESAPKPGQQWISPRLSSDLTPGGFPNASTWPTGKGVTEPPAAADALFKYDGSATVFRPDGSEVTVHSPEEYKAVIAANRAQLGITKPDGSPAGGEPVGVHLTLEGGGGLGKRYSPAFSEMYSAGIVPTSVSGTSVGAIAAGYIAAGADPKQVAALATDPALQKFFDFKLGGSALMKGDFMYKYVDQQLRELTGIKDRPVTFADLKIPLHLPACIMSDSMPPAGTDYTKPENRLFMFSQENTPNTPVVYAMLASGAFPGVLPTVDLVDPASGRKLVLTDSGVIDGVPMDLGKKGLPEVGLTLQEPHDNHPDAPSHNTTPKPYPAGDVDTSNPLAYGLNSLKMLKDGGAEAKDFHDRTQPKPGEFMLAVPIFNLEDARKTDKSLIFGYNDKLDPELDRQGHQVARDFFKGVFNRLEDPNASATNLTTVVPQNLHFDTTLDYDGTRYRAQYNGGDTVSFTKPDGSKLDLKIGKLEVEAMYLDQAAYGGHVLEGELKTSLEDHFDPIAKIRRGLPF